MHYFIEDKKNSKKYASFSAQAGVSSLLFIVLVGLSLTVLTVGYMSSMRNLQSSAITTHAQTQAQMQAMIGYHALTEYLNKLSKESNGLQKIDQVCDGEIKETDKDAQIIFERVGACNNSVVGQQFIFDVTGKSGGASAILRANFNIVDEEKISSHEGSIFAGGLKVQSKETIQALTENVAISIGANKTEGLESGNIYLSNGKDVVNYDPATDGIKVNKFEGGLDLIPAADMKQYANFIFKNVGGSIVCEKQNLNGVLITTSFVCPYYETIEKIKGKDTLVQNHAITRESSGNTSFWVVDVDRLIKSKTHLNKKFDGIFWFEGDVVVRLPNSQNDSSKYFRNTIITTGNLTIEKDTSSSSGELNLFSPYDYIIATDITSQILVIEKQLNTGKDLNGNLLTESQKQVLRTNKDALLLLRLSTMKARLLEVCLGPGEYPTALCKSDFTQQQVNEITNYDDILAVENKFLKDISKYPTSLFNLIGMADDGFVVHADENIKTNLFGNLIGSKGAGNTGKASGKFAGTGQIEVMGNLVVAKDMDLTEMKGNVTIKLGQSKANGSFIPIKDKSFNVNGIRYM